MSVYSILEPLELTGTEIESPLTSTICPCIDHDGNDNYPFDSNNWTNYCLNSFDGTISTVYNLTSENLNQASA